MSSISQSWRIFGAVRCTFTLLRVGLVISVVRPPIRCVFLVVIQIYCPAYWIINPVLNTTRICSGVMITYRTPVSSWLLILIVSLSIFPFGLSTFSSLPIVLCKSAVQPTFALHYTCTVIVSSRYLLFFG